MDAMASPAPSAAPSIAASTAPSARLSTAAAAAASSSSSSSPAHQVRRDYADCERLLSQLDSDLARLLDAATNAYNEDDESAQPAVDVLASPPASLSNLVALLSRSALGAFVPTATTVGPTAPLPAPASASGAHPAGTETVSQAQLDLASDRSQALFKHLQLLRDRAEVVRSALAR